MLHFVGTSPVSYGLNIVFWCSDTAHALFLKHHIWRQSSNFAIRCCAIRAEVKHWGFRIEGL